MSTSTTRSKRKAANQLSVRIGDAAVGEEARQTQLDGLSRAIETWAKKRDLWFDTWFHVPFLQRDERPEPYETLLMTTEGPLCQILGHGQHAQADKYERQFRTLIERLGFSYEMANHYTVALYPTEDRLREEFLVFNRWRWVQHLASRRLFDIHREVFEHFAARPDDVYRLSWRQYEELLDAVFRNQGFVTELGPGGNDGNVDIRLYQSAALPELVALVQAKKYKNPIKYEAVAALQSTARMERAPRAIFATTSRFLPSAQKFALATQQEVNFPPVELADAGKVRGWCEDIARHLEQFFSSGVLTAPFTVPPGASSELVGKIVVASGGHDVTMNSFAIIEADFPHEVILRPIGAKKVSGDVQSGTEVPAEEARVTWTSEARLTAFKSRSKIDQRLHFWGDRKLFSLWDGQPEFFHLLD